MRRSPTALLLGAIAACRVVPAPPKPPPSGAGAVAQISPAAALEPVAASALCVSSGRITAAGPHALHVDEGGMRAELSNDRSRTAELAFVYRGPSTATARLADGELRRQIGLKLRAQDTCNIVYVMWHAEPRPGIVVQVKRNVGQASHGECADRGYTLVKPRTVASVPAIERGVPTVLRADLEGTSLRVSAGGLVIWQGDLPPEALSFDGPVGVRSDNGVFDFELRVPAGHATPSCGAPGPTKKTPTP